MNAVKSLIYLECTMAKSFALTIETDQQDNVKNGAVNIIDEMKNMMEKEMS